MEKLIELLNEHAHTYADHYDDTGEEIEIKFLEHTDNCFIYYCDWKFDSLVDDVVISKRFGFISWLVESRKIDRSKVNFENIFYEYDWEYITYEKIILMLLAISDTPIDFLCSILK